MCVECGVCGVCGVCVVCGVWSVLCVECDVCGVCGVCCVWSVMCMECDVCGVWSVLCVECDVCGVWCCGVCGVWCVWSVVYEIMTILYHTTLAHEVIGIPPAIYGMPTIYGVPKPFNTFKASTLLKELLRLLNQNHCAFSMVRGISFNNLVNECHTPIMTTPPSCRS